MDKFPKLNFPSVRFRAMRKAGKVFIWDDIRKCYLELTPEEWVRQHVIAMLVRERGIPPLHIVEEYPIDLNGQAQRADIVVMDELLNPCLLVECKAPSVGLDETVLAQAVRYNHILQARQIMLTNGLQHLFYQMTEDKTEYRQVCGLSF